ncbi:hypothetical protein ACQ33O_06225 [Ferruginibacter sp. SUN002]|uniref:hypothetical protein n=1 Tax=Ferruginibacter sp. SUN002 TaxID=2937789 RepID=UPI003D35F494
MPKIIFLLCIIILSNHLGNAQNVGIGNPNPLYKLQVHDTSSNITFMNITNKSTGINASDGLLVGINGTSAIVGNLENGNLRLATNNFTRMVIDSVGNVGIGPYSLASTFPDYKLDVAGDINTTGLIRLNGSPGTAGQVLASNGNSDPTWVNSAFAGNTRFAVELNQFSPATTSTTTGGVFSISEIRYNLNTTNVTTTVGANSITINKTGLYHFEVDFTTQFYYNVSVTPTAPPELTSYLAINYTGAFNHYLAYGTPMWKSKTTTNATYYYNGKMEMDVYIEAPKTLTLYSNMGRLDGPTNSVTQIGYLWGHLISD